MTHALTSIRQAAVALLQARFQRVYAHRTAIVKAQQMPCVFVYVNGRRSSKIGLSPPMYQHTVNQAVVLCVQHNENAEYLINQMLGEVETLFAQSSDLAIPNLVQSLEPTALSIEQDDTGEINTLYYQQNFNVVYFSGD